LRKDPVLFFAQMLIVAFLAFSGLFLIEDLLRLPLSSSGFVFLKTQLEPSTLKEFTECLAKKNAVLYTTNWCSNCKNQALLFGKNYEWVPVVNCTPKGKLGPIAPACLQKNISFYPTWLIENKKFEGTQTLTALAQTTGCRLS
jgi:hypothetical protein